MNLRLLFTFLIISTNVSHAQTDSLRYDKWIGWVTPTSLLNLYHPALELGVEYNQKKHLAYSLMYGLDIANKENKAYDNQNHQYVRLGIKKYTRDKFSSGYLMGELGIFHLSHYGQGVSWKDQNDIIVHAKFHEFLFKPGIIIGGKVKAGNMRFDFFTGIGYRFGFRKHNVLSTTSSPNYHGGEIHGMFNPADHIVIDSNSGWTNASRKPYLSLGIRVGIGFKPIVIPKF